MSSEPACVPASSGQENPLVNPDWKSRLMVNRKGQEETDGHWLLSAHCRKKYNTFCGYLFLGTNKEPDVNFDKNILCMS